MSREVRATVSSGFEAAVDEHGHPAEGDEVEVAGVLRRAQRGDQPAGGQDEHEEWNITLHDLNTEVAGDTEKD